MTTKVQQGLHFVTPGTAAPLGSGSAVAWAAPVAGNFVVAGFTQANTPGVPSTAEAGLNLVTAYRTNGAANIRCSLWAGVVPAGGGWDTLQLDTDNSDNIVLEAAEFSHAGATGWTTHVAASAGTEVTNGASLASGDVVVTDPNAIVVALIGFQGNTAGAAKPTFTNGFTTVSLNRYGALGVLIPGAAGTYNTTIGWTNSANALCVTAAFSPTVSASGGRRLQFGGLRL